MSAAEGVEFINLKAVSSENFLLSLAISLAVLVAFVVQHAYSFSHAYWLTLAAFVVGQTTRGTPLRQGLVFFMVMMVAVLMGSILQAGLSTPAVLYLIVTVLFMISHYFLFVNKPSRPQLYWSAMLFPIFFMLAVFSPSKIPEFNQARLVDIVIGSVIGLVCVNGLFPIKVSKTFSDEVLPLLQALRDHVHELALFLQGKTTSSTTLSANKTRIETILSASGQYPEWVYEVGFNYGLRAGFRFFLIQLERMTEVVFSMEFIAFAHIDPLLLDALLPNIIEAMQKNEELITLLITYFSTRELQHPQTNFTSDIVELEHGLNRLLPPSLELIDISKNNLLLTALVRDIKDMRDILLQLVLALK